MIFCLEGPDGTGKSTLAQRLANEVKGSIIHAYYKKDWNMKNYHESIIKAASLLSDFNPVILDRWAPSEHVYAKVFREGESYNTKTLINKWKDKIVWIYCRNDNAVANHLKNKEVRNEMFLDMTRVVKEFDQYVKSTPELNWLIFDFDKIDTNEFLLYVDGYVTNRETIRE